MAVALTGNFFICTRYVAQYQKSGITYLAPNISSPGNKVYFMADPPHVLKTVRNAWYNSRKNGTRNLVVIHISYIVIFYLLLCIMQNRGGEIKWAHLIELAEKATSATGLYFGNKLTREHLILISYSRMNVRLAANILCILYTYIHRC